MFRILFLISWDINFWHMAEISAVFREISHFCPKYASTGKMVNVQKMRNFFLDMGMQKFLEYDAKSKGGSQTWLFL